MKAYPCFFCETAIPVTDLTEGDWIVCLDCVYEYDLEITLGLITPTKYGEEKLSTGLA